MDSDAKTAKDLLKGFHKCGLAVAAPAAQHQAELRAAAREPPGDFSCLPPHVIGRHKCALAALYLGLYRGDKYARSIVFTERQFKMIRRSRAVCQLRNEEVGEGRRPVVLFHSL